ncbi:hypothetical protein HMSSN036_70030 [Paenibacillus macerans]|nr:hypothetical protein HMSSN036_70030 [Paenibacillus macerans]
MTTNTWREKIPKPKKNHYRWLIYVLLVLVYIWAFAGIPFDGIKETAGQITKSIFAGLFSPDWGYVYLPDGEDLLRGLLDTLAISILGTVISTIVCLPFAFWAAANMSRTRWISGPGKMVLSFVRTFRKSSWRCCSSKRWGPVPSPACWPWGCTRSGCSASCSPTKLKTWIKDRPKP